MSSTQVTDAAVDQSLVPARRVRHQARDAATLMAFSAATSLGAALLLTLVTSLGR